MEAVQQVKHPAFVADRDAALAPEGIEFLDSYTGDGTDILKCLHRCFRDTATRRHWQHLFAENPAGSSIICIARHGDQVVAHQGLLRRRASVFGHDTWIGAHVDGMTDPDWRKQGLKTHIAENSRRIAVADGASAIYSFANDLSLPGIVKHQRRTAIGALPVMFRLLRPVRGATAIVGDWLSTHLRGQVSTMATLPGSATAGPMPDNWQASRDLFTQLGWSDARFSPDDTALFANAADLPRINMKRDGDQLNWRYRDAIGATYLRRDLRDKNGLVATLVIRPLLIAGLKVVFVMEWHWQQKASGQEMVLMEELLDSARKAGVHAVAALSMAGTRQSAKLRRNGFFQVPSALLPANATLTVGPETDMIERYHWFEPANWYLTWGDGFLI